MFAILNTDSEILPWCHFYCSSGITNIVVSFLLHIIDCVYLFSTTYFTDLSFYHKKLVVVYHK